MTMATPSAGVQLRRRRGGGVKRTWSGYLYLLPFLIPFAVFTFYPIVYSAVLSFQDYTPNPMAPDPFVGWDNYARALGDATFWRSLGNVLLLMGVVLPCQLAFGFFIATLMHNKLRRTALLSGVFYLPVVANLIVVTLIFQVLFQYNGFVNWFIGLFGIGNVGWLTDPFWAPVTTMTLIFWKGVGWYIVFLLAGMKNIDPAYYEAAELDGANSFQKAIHVSLPQLRPVIVFLLVLGIISGWQIFVEPRLLFSQIGPGGPANAVLTPSNYIYGQSMEQLDFSYGSALSIILGVITAICSLLALWLGRRANK
jgi:ABC-type sugar transport system permease subunit